MNMQQNVPKTPEIAYNNLHIIEYKSSIVIIRISKLKIKGTWGFYTVQQTLDKMPNKTAN